MVATNQTISGEEDRSQMIKLRQPSGMTVSQARHQHFSRITQLPLATYLKHVVDLCCTLLTTPMTNMLLHLVAHEGDTPVTLEPLMPYPQRNNLLCAF